MGVVTISYFYTALEHLSDSGEGFQMSWIVMFLILTDIIYIITYNQLSRLFTDRNIMCSFISINLKCGLNLCNELVVDAIFSNCVSKTKL